MLFLINMHGSSHVGPWALECWKHFLEEKDARMTERCEAWSVLVIQLHGHEGYTAFLCCTSCTLCTLEAVCWWGWKGFITLFLWVCVVCVMLPWRPCQCVCAWGPILSWHYSLIKNLAMMKNTELNSAEVKIAPWPFSLDQRFPGCASPWYLNTELEGPSLCIRSF